MAKEYIQRAFDWADRVVSEAGCKVPPVDLHAIACLTGVRHLELCLMVHRGALVPVHGGYELFLRSTEPAILDLTKPEDPNLLTTRQRLAFAHEVAHIRFFKNSGGTPLPTDEVEDERELEDLCDSIARRILVPQRMLLKEISGGPGDADHIDSEFVHAMKLKFRASYEVIISRINLSNLKNGSPRCIVLVRSQNGVHKVIEWYFGLRILSILTPPKERYQPLRDWFKEAPDGFERGFTSKEEQMRMRKKALILRRFPIGRGEDFLLQVDEVSEDAFVNEQA